MIRQIRTVLRTLLEAKTFLFEGCRKISAYGKKGNIRQIRYFGVFYALELFNYQLPNIILRAVPPQCVTPGEPNGDCRPPTEFDISYYHKDILFTWLHLGMLVGMIAFGTLIWKYPKSLRKFLNGSLVFHAIGALLTAIMIWQAHHDLGFNDDVMIHVIGVGRFIFGVGFSAGLGLIITLVVENLPRSFRTWAATLIGVIGFLGPVIAECLDELFVNKITLLFVGAIASLVFPFLFNPPKNSNLRHDDGEKQSIRLLGKLFSNGETLKLFMACLLLGVSVQFFSDMVAWLQRVSSLWQHEWAHGLRYTGLCFGTLIAGVLSKFLNHRRKVIFGFICLQIIACLATAGVHGYYHGHGYVLDENDWHSFVTGCIFFSLGLVCGHWIITVVQTAEQFSIRERSVMLIFIPNVYRMATLVIVLLNLFYASWVKTGGWIENYSLILFAFWLVFVFASLAASVIVKDNFEGDAYEAPLHNELDYHRNHLVNVAGNSAREKIQNGIDEKLWITRDDRPFLRELSSNLFQHLKSTRQMDGVYVLSTIFYAEDSRRRLEFAGFGINKDQFDVKTCKRYDIGLSAGESYSPVDHHMSVHQLIKEDAASSIALWLTTHAKLSGALMYFSGWREKLDDEHLEHYRSFDLAQIRLSKEHILEFVPLIRKELPVAEKIVLLDRYFEYYGNTFDGAFREFIFGDEDPSDFWTEEKLKKLKKTILMHRLDAEDYGAGNYYSYYLNPYIGYENPFKLALVLKTVAQLPKNALGQTRDLITSVLLYRNGKMHKFNAEQVFRDEEHSTRSILLSIQRNLDEFQSWAIKTKLGFENNLPFNINKLDSIQSALKDSGELVEKLYQLRVFNMALIRFNGGAGRAELEAKNLPAPEFVDVCQMVNSIIRREKKIKIINSIPPNVQVQVIKSALYIILSELIQNAIFYAPKDNHSIHIRWEPKPEKQPEFYELHIENNLKPEVKESNLKALKEMVNERVYDTSGRLGIPSIHRILNFRLITFSGEPWRFQCDYTLQRVDLFLIIPKVDVHQKSITYHAAKGKNFHHRR